MVILIDSRQQDKPHNRQIESYIKSQGIDTIHTKLLTGDYIIANKGNISVDSKQHIGELYQDLVSDHVRFRNECITAQRCGIQLFILTPNADGVMSLEDLPQWKNPQASIYSYRQANGKPVKGKPPTDSATLAKIAKTMEQKYGVKFLFCPTGHTGEVLLDVLLRSPIENSF